MADWVDLITPRNEELLRERFKEVDRTGEGKVGFDALRYFLGADTVGDDEVKNLLGLFGVCPDGCITFDQVKRVHMALLRDSFERFAEKGLIPKRHVAAALKHVGTQLTDSEIATVTASVHAGDGPLTFQQYQEVWTNAEWKFRTPFWKVLLAGATAHGIRREYEDLLEDHARLTHLLSSRDDLLKKSAEDECMRALRNTLAFHKMADVNLRKLARICVVREFERGELIATEEGADMAFVITSGQVKRFKPDSHSEVALEFEVSNTLQTIGTFSLHHPSHSLGASAECTEDVVAVCIPGPAYRDLLLSDTTVTLDVIESLSDRIRVADAIPRTALLSQQARPIPLHYTLAVGFVEALYRTSTTALLRRYLGVTFRFVFPGGFMGEFEAGGIKFDRMAQKPSPAPRPFPSTLGGRMLTEHWAKAQVCYRAGLITAVKQLRIALENRYGADEFRGYQNPQLLRGAMALMPGLVMTPFSGLMEATQIRVFAQHVPNQSLVEMALSGAAARSVRDVLFTLGLNQVSDFIEERCPVGWDGTARTLIGSSIAGALCGYLSHTPNTLANMKLLYPKKSYLDHMKHIVSDCESRLPPETPPRLVTPLSTLLAVVLPRGVVIRSLQIMGSYCIVNGLIHSLAYRH